VDATQPALAGLAPRRRRVRAPEAVAGHLPVAQVIVDRPQPHLDRVFDYAVPASLAAEVRPGVRVRVRFGGRDVAGFCVARRERSEHDGELTPLRAVVSTEVVLTPAVLAMARAVARRWVGATPDVLRLAVPARHARVEQEVWPEAARQETPTPAARQETPTPAAQPSPAWADYPAVGAYLRRLAAGESPRAVWQALPAAGGSGWPDAVADAVMACAAGGRGAVVVVPTGPEVDEVGRALDARGLPGWEPARPGGWVRLVADDGPALRYRAFLATVRGSASVVVGTRAAAFAPVQDLGLAVCWDEASDLHAEPHAPYPNVREVLAMRATAEDAALLVGGYARSVAAQRLVSTGWAKGLEPPRHVVRARTARVTALTSAELARDGPAAGARLPGAAWRAARDALRSGPVLVQVPRAGYLPIVACQRCRALARCPKCSGPLHIRTAGAAAECRWCGRPAAGWRCPECSGTGLRSVVVGSARTAEEIGRAFPGVPVRLSGSATGVVPAVPDEPALVVATPGAEPPAPTGYAAALLLDAAVVTSRPTLDVAEQAVRTWMRAASLVRPATEGGVVLLVGDGDPTPTQALVRWDPLWLTDRELTERLGLRLPPAVHVVVLEGPRHAVERLVAAADLPAGCEVLGPTAVREAGTEPPPATLLEPDGERAVRALIRSPWSDAEAVVAAVGAAQRARAARREHLVRVHVEPSELW
jgi:primosomal protein N' (replication factor Y)